jgi:atypical dual specificity phosphatase
MTEDEYEWLLEKGVKSIVTVREVPLPKDWISSDHHMSYLHLRVEDYGAPTLEEVDATVDFMYEQIEKEKPVMVHCAAGKGRTGTVLAAYIMKYQGLAAEKAIERIRQVRPGSIQSEQQETSLYMYEKYLTNKKE